MSSSPDAMIPVSTFMVRDPRPGAPAVPLGVSAQLYRRHMAVEAITTGLPMPRSLSPSSMSTFTSCPLSFRFSYIEKLPEPPSAPASKGTLVHLALQHLMWRPAADRTLEAALDDLDRARRELMAHAEFAELTLTDEEWDAFHADAEVLVRRYFELEDPRLVRPIGIELFVRAELGDGTHVRGIIDRLELDEHGDLVITDYKTGNAPG